MIFFDKNWRRGGKVHLHCFSISGKPTKCSFSCAMASVTALHSIYQCLYSIHDAKKTGKVALKLQFPWLG